VTHYIKIFLDLVTEFIFIALPDGTIFADSRLYQKLAGNANNANVNKSKIKSISKDFIGKKVNEKNLKMYKWGLY